jgi:hypothetical protein
MHQMDSPDDSYETSEEQINPPNHEGIKTVPNPSEMDPEYKVGDKQWKMIGGRRTIVNKKGEILQWDSKKGEVELYRNKQHQGGFDPYDRNRQISKPVGNRTPNGGWNLASHKFFDMVSRIVGVPLLFIPDVVRMQTNPYQLQNQKM